MNGLRLYRRYAAASLRAQLQYRASFVMTTFGTLLQTGIEFIAIAALFARFGQVRGWTLPEVALFYSMISITWALCDSVARGFDIFDQTLKAGDFDRVLVRPRSTVLQLLGQELTLRRIGRLAQGVAVLGYAIAAGHIAWTLPRVLLYLGSLVCGACVFMGIVVLQATTAFWTTESLEVWNAFTYGGVTMCQYPISIYRPWLRGLFTYAIPLACVNYLPGLAILGRGDALDWAAPLVGPLFLAACLQIWRIGIRHYRSTGS